MTSNVSSLSKKNLRLQILSDLHNEFGLLEEPQAPDADIVILAGDIHEGKKAAQWALENFTVPVVMIAGNHEFYAEDTSMLTLVQEAKLLCKGSHVHYLQDEMVNIHGVNFVGATLWTDYSLLGESELAKMAAHQRMRDFRKIAYTDHSMGVSTDNLLQSHVSSRQFIERSLDSMRGQNNVVITHHAPTGLSLPEHFRQHPLAASYASSLDDVIVNHDIRLWIHGHIHHSRDYSHPYKPETRILCNPRGYNGLKLNENFEKYKIIELDI